MTKEIEEGDCVLVYENTLDHQHRSLRKFSFGWFGCYEVQQTLDNGVDWLSELDGTSL